MPQHHGHRHSHFRPRQAKNAIELQPRHLLLGTGACTLAAAGGLQAAPATRGFRGTRHQGCAAAFASVALMDCWDAVVKLGTPTGHEMDLQLAAKMVVALLDDGDVGDVDHKLHARGPEGVQRVGPHEGVNGRARHLVPGSRHSHMCTHGLPVPLRYMRG